MKRYWLPLTLALMVLVLGGCKAAQAPAPQEEPPGGAAALAERAAVELETLLGDIWDAAPGTAGSSLKQAKAAGALLDWAQEGNTAAPAKVEAWLAEKGTGQGALAWGYAAVLDFADRMLQGDANAAAMLEEAGYTPLHDQYDAERYHQAARSLSPLFTQLMDAWAVTSSYVFEDPTAYDKLSLEQFRGIWCDGEVGELLVILGGKCRVVIPYLDELGDTAYEIRLRERSALGYCPALEIDTGEGDGYDGALTYYISGVEQDHFWSNTQAQRFERMPVEG